MRNGLKTLAMWLIIGIIFMVVLVSIIDNGDNKLSYSDLLMKIESGEVSEIEIVILSLIITIWITYNLFNILVLIFKWLCTKWKQNNVIWKEQSKTSSK